MRAIFVSLAAIAAALTVLPLWTDLEVYERPQAAPDAWEGSYVDLPSGRTHYVEAGSGPTVLLIAGLTGNTTVWERSVDALAAHFRVLAIDMYGRGFSERRNSYAYDRHTYRSQLGEFLAALDITETALVGSSMGGAIAIDFAASVTDRIWGLVLVNSAGLPFDTPAAKRLLHVPYVGEYLIVVAMPTILRQGFREGFYDLGNADARFRQRYSRSAEIVGFRRAVLESLRRFPLHGLQPEIETIAQTAMPSLIFWGEGDQVVPLEVYRGLRALMPQARGIVLHNARHMPHAERADMFAPTTAEFLKEAYNQRQR